MFCKLGCSRGNRGLKLGVVSFWQRSSSSPCLSPVWGTRPVQSVHRRQERCWRYFPSFHRDNAACCAPLSHPNSDKISHPKGVTDVSPPWAQLILLNQTGVPSLLLLRSLRSVAGFAKSRLKIVGGCGPPRVLSMAKSKHHRLSQCITKYVSNHLTPEIL